MGLEKINNTFSVSMLLMLFITLSSCTGDDSGVDFSSSKEPPVLERVSLVDKDSTTSEGLRGNLYAIYGKNLSKTTKITFSDSVAYFNPTLVTDTNILVSIPDSAPYFGGSNKLTVTTQAGTASLDFAVAQPTPNIEGFSPLAAGAGEIVTITGSVFEGLESVRFGEIEAEIVSSTATEIQVRVPEGVVQSFIFVETAGGITQSGDAFGFKYLIYDDALNASWWVGGWSGTQDFENTSQVKRGDFSIQRIYEGGYSGFQIGNGGAEINLEDYQAIKISIYGGDNIGSLRFSVNGLNNMEIGVVLEIEQGVWNNFTIPFSDLNGDQPALQVLSEIVIQEFSGNAPSTIYIDDLGLI